MALALRRLLAAPALAACLLGAGCRSLGGTKGTELTYGEVQKIQRGLTASQILDSFGNPGRMQRGPDGKIVGMTYVTQDANQRRAHVVLGFDAREVLVTKDFTGAIPHP